jgi:hypothetical protein
VDYDLFNGQLIRTPWSHEAISFYWIIRLIPPIPFTKAFYVILLRDARLTGISSIPNAEI